MERIWQFNYDKVEERCDHILTMKELSDCTFLVGSETNPKKFRAHKLILAMASPEFQHMFYDIVYGVGLTLRNKPNIPMISDIEPEVFEALLKYIYTGNTYIDSLDMASGLLYGADKYRLPHLVKKCDRYICSVLSPSNVCRAYELACQYNLSTLIDKCIQLISKNTKMVLNDNSFKDVELNTMITIFSLNHLTVDNELDLFDAVAKYAGIEQMKQGQISPNDEGLPSEPSTSEEKVSLSDEISSPTSPVTELDSKAPTEVVTTKPMADKENLKEEGSRERRPIRAALEKIRFLTLTPAQFASVCKSPAGSGLLTDEESFALFMNIASRACGVDMPAGFSQSDKPRSATADVDDDDEDWNRPRSKPSTEASGVAVTQLPTAAEIVRGLMAGAPLPEAMELEHAARAARQMTYADVYCSSVNLTRLVEAGGIPPLVAALYDTRTSVQYDAAWAITNIACDDEYAEALVKAGAVCALAKLLNRGGAGAEAELAAQALGNIAHTDGKTVVYYGAEPLLALMQPSTPSQTLRTYVRSLRIMSASSNFPDPYIISWADFKYRLVKLATPCIENLLVLTDEQVLVDACWAVYYLSRKIGFCGHPHTETLVARVIALLGHTAPRVQSAALRAMDTITDSTYLRDKCFEAGYLDQIINFLKCGKTSTAKNAGIVLLYFLKEKPQKNQQAVDKQILDAVEPLLTEGNDELKLVLVEIMGCIYTKGSAVDKQILDALEPLLTDGNNELKLFVVEVMSYISTKGSAVDKQILDALEPLLTEGNDEFKLKVVKIMRGICTDGSASQLNFLAEGAALEHYCRLLAVENTCNDVREGLYELLERIDENKRAPLILKLREFDVPQHLITLLYVENDYMRESAEHVLENYFRDDVGEHSQDTS